MPWKEVSVMSLRWEFVELANQSNVNFSQLCRRFGISRDKGYKWLRRYRAEGPAGVEGRGRRAPQSPGRAGRKEEQRVVRSRDSHSGWGGREIQDRLPALGLGGGPGPTKG